VEVDDVAEDDDPVVDLDRVVEGTLRGHDGVRDPCGVDAATGRALDADAVELALLGRESLRGPVRLDDEGLRDDVDGELPALEGVPGGVLQAAVGLVRAVEEHDRIARGDGVVRAVRREAVHARLAPRAYPRDGTGTDGALDDAGVVAGAPFGGVELRHTTRSDALDTK
jgi:hypothetical protein